MGRTARDLSPVELSLILHLRVPARGITCYYLYPDRVRLGAYHGRSEPTDVVTWPPHHHLCYTLAMENLWAPWRMAFIAPKTPPPPGCIFCTQPAAQRDEEYYIVYRGEHCFMMLNLYPYSNGHLMVAPYQHVGSIEGLDAATLAELMAQAQLALRALRFTMKPDGFNMGINEGKVAGAGFAEHMHFHIVPRWHGDTNFMPVIADIKVMPEHLDTVYRQLRQAIETIKEGS